MTDEVQDYNDVQGMIGHAMDQDWNNANKIFGDIMTMKVQDLLDQEKVKLADQIYNGAEEEPEIDDTPTDDEQLELDLEDEVEVTDDELMDALEDDDEEEEFDDEEPEEEISDESEES